MARRLIGLDIGTNAVRVAELELSEPPRLTSFGQVALPPESTDDAIPALEESIAKYLDREAPA